ncbi:MAG: hypothetical protein HPY65_07910 [Syntrophaceae bacterium]|nr:hypothetical protein [Syntrophaceae bacterium]
MGVLRRKWCWSFIKQGKEKIKKMKCPRCDAELNESDFKVDVGKNEVEVSVTCPGCEASIFTFIQADEFLDAE